MTTTREAVQELASLLERDRQGYVNPFDVAAHLRRILEETEETEEPSVELGELHVHGPGPDAQLRLSALDQALRAQTEHEQATQTVDRARAFYAFLAAAEQPTTTDEATR